MECVELHCSGAAKTHEYGDDSCDWTYDEDTETLSPKEQDRD